MNGQLIPDTPICVDYWKVARNVRHQKIFFLSHMHADHTSGLSPSWRHPIYCSEISAALLQSKFSIPNDVIKPLEAGQRHVIILDQRCGETMTVTVIDANHCPGSVMFLFESYFGRILYTGDFRFMPDMVRTSALGGVNEHVDVFGRNPQKFQNLDHGTEHTKYALKSVDVLYLDNTFCNRTCTFPTRNKARQRIIDIILRHPDYKVMIGIYTLGKEDLLVDLALQLKTWIVVSPSRFKTIQCLQLPNVFTTDPDARLIRVVFPREILSKLSMEKWNEVSKTIAILPTGLYTGLTLSPFSNQDNVFIVPYSDHSSYPELCEFVRWVRPKKILPIVPARSRGVFGTSVAERADMHCFDEYLNSSPYKKFVIPKWFPCYSCDKNVVVARPVVRKRRKVSARGVVFTDSESPSNESDCAELIKQSRASLTLNNTV